LFAPIVGEGDIYLFSNHLQPNSVSLSTRKHAQKRILVSEASKVGKTIVTKVIAEELLKDKMPVPVFYHSS
jgi:hypothetical protein